MELAKAVGRRKTAVAQIHLRAGSGSIEINGKPAEQYLSGSPSLLLTVKSPLQALEQTSFDLVAQVRGGGLQAQAEALRLAISRALVNVSPDSRSVLRSYDFLTRDAREKERRKYGLKKARKAPQYSKRLLDPGPFGFRFFVIWFTKVSFFLFVLCPQLPTKFWKN